MTVWDDALNPSGEKVPWCSVVAMPLFLYLQKRRRRKAPPLPDKI